VTKIYYRQTMKQTVSDAIEIACAQYNTLEQCREKLPQALETMRNQIPKDINERKTPIASTSFITPLITIARRFQE